MCKVDEKNKSDEYEDGRADDVDVPRVEYEETVGNEERSDDKGEPG